jgi:hypothetical protein
VLALLSVRPTREKVARIGNAPTAPTANDSPGDNLLARSSATLLSDPSGVTSPILRVILERAWAGSRPRARQDDHLVCLAIAGGRYAWSGFGGYALYEDAAIRGVIDRMRPLVRRPVVNFARLFAEAIGACKPLSFEGSRRVPSFVP